MEAKVPVFRKAVTANVKPANAVYVTSLKSNYSSSLVMDVDNLMTFPFRKKSCVTDADLFTCCSLTRSLSKRVDKPFDDPNTQFLSNVIGYGFKLVSDVCVVSLADRSNYPSAANPQAKGQLDQIFRKELMAGCISPSLAKPLRINAIGAVGKSDSATPRPVTDAVDPSIIR